MFVLLWASSFFPFLGGGVASTILKKVSVGNAIITEKGVAEFVLIFSLASERRYTNKPATSFFFYKKCAHRPQLSVRIIYSFNLCFFIDTVEERDPVQQPFPHQHCPFNLFPHQHCPFNLFSAIAEQTIKYF